MFATLTSPKSFQDYNFSSDRSNQNDGLNQKTGPDTITLNFSNLIPGINAKAYNESGYCLFGSSLHCSARGVASPTKGVYSGVSSKNLTLKRLDGACFDLLSLELSNLNGQIDTQNCILKGRFPNGGKVYFSIKTMPMTFGYQSYVLPSSFKGLSSVELGSGLVITTRVVLR